MKFAAIKKGTRAVKAVPFRLANAPDPKPVEPGQDIPLDEYTHLVGVRVLTGDEAAEVLEKAQTDAKKRGVPQWLDTHPLCRLYEMAHTVALACVDNEARDEPFFASVEEVLSAPDVGEDNIAYLYEQQKAWQDECSIRTKDLTVEQVMGLLAQEAERPENAPSPFSHLRAASLPSFFRITAFLFRDLLRVSLLSTSSADTSGTPSSSSTSSDADVTPEAPASPETSEG